MGSHHSVPVLVDDILGGGGGNEKPKRKFGDRRGKLTKPRTNTNADSGQCLQFTSKLGGFGVLLSRRPATAPASAATRTDDFFPRPPNASTPPPREAHRTGRPRPLSHVIYRKDSLQEAVTDLSMPLRRRATLRAAPPATISRRPHQPAPAPTIEIDEVSPHQPPPTLQALDLALAVDFLDPRSGTPSGYSVLGNFKRGSLRIMNGNPSPSPAPSSAPTSPMLTPQFQTEDVPSPSMLLEEYLNPRDSIRIVPPSPSLYPNHNRLSFEESPLLEWTDVHDDTEPLALPGPTPETTVATPFERFATSKAPQRPIILQNQSPYDSGYSSTDSTTSWRTACELPANVSERTTTIAALEGGLLGSSAMLRECRSFPSPSPSPLQRHRGKWSAPLAEEYINVHPGVSRASSCSAATPDTLDRITGQEYYQRFSRRRNSTLAA